MDIDISAADTANVTLLFTGNLRRPVFGIFPGWMKFLIFIGFVDPIPSYPNLLAPLAYTFPDRLVVKMKSLPQAIL